jgi:hypothetical protein
MTVKRASGPAIPSKPSGEHPAVQSFRAKVDSIADTTIPILDAEIARIDRARSAPPRSADGEWTITIRGLGSLPPNANTLAWRLIQELRQAGHAVTLATLTHGANISADIGPEATSPPPAPPSSPVLPPTTITTPSPENHE